MGAAGPLERWTFSLGLRRRKPGPLASRVDGHLFSQTELRFSTPPPDPTKPTT